MAGRTDQARVFRRGDAALRWAAMAAAGCVLGARAATAPAATLQWDTNFVTAGAQGGSGAWVDNGPGWWDGGNDINWTAGNDADFGAPAGTVLVNGTVTAASLTFDVPGYQILPDPILGGTITLTATGGLVANGDATIGATIA